MSQWISRINFNDYYLLITILPVIIYSKRFSVSDVWDTDVSLDNDLALSSAYNVLRQHAASHDADLDPMFLGTSAQRAAINSVMPNLRTLPSKTSAERAMQRLATQRGFELLRY